MRVWRLCRAPYADLSGEGARRFGGRWNAPGRPVIYAAADPALTVLEVRVHLDLPLELLPDDYCLLSIETGPASCEQAPATIQDNEHRRDFGERWLVEQRSALLQVSSVIVPESYNVLINPLHPEANLIQIVSQRAFQFDERLF